MSFEVKYHPRFIKRLKVFSPSDRTKVLRKLELLSSNPFDPSLNIRKMANTSTSYRIRVGNIRSIYEIDFEKEIIYILDIDYRGNIY